MISPGAQHDDPLVALRQKTLRTLLLGACVFIGTLAWALWPAAVRDAVDGPVGPSKGFTMVTPSEQLAINWSDFDAPIWNPSPAPASPPAPPPPMRLQLIAITRETGPSGTAYFTASLYDPDTDTLSIVRAGEKVAARKVVKVDALWVDIADTMGTRRLTLDAPASAAAPLTIGASSGQSRPTGAVLPGSGGGGIR